MGSGLSRVHTQAMEAWSSSALTIALNRMPTQAPLQNGIH